jgi:hypothetical protein
VFVVFLLCATAYVQAAALESAPEHHHSADHCCLLCHIGPLPFLQGSTCVKAAPVLPVECRVWYPTSESSHDVLLAPSPSRGPPA